MSCKTKCSTKKHLKCPNSGNGYPSSGSDICIPVPNLPVDDWREYSNSDVYFYVITTIAYRDGQFVQTGTGPNFQGGRITLCTCKHYMRSLLSTQEWERKYIAGFTSINCVQNERRNFLVYFMKVSNAFDSFYDLCSNNIPGGIINAKSAHVHRLGDIYRPLHENIGPYVADDYEAPCPNHARGECWRTDIEYSREYRNGEHRAKLLVGSKKQSGSWSRPTTYFNNPDRPNGIGAGHRRLPLNEFLRELIQI